MSDEIVARLRLEGQRAFDAGLDRVTAKMTAVGDAAIASTKAATHAYERMTASLLTAGEALDDQLERIDALRLATVAYADEQLELSEQWVKDGDVLRAQAHTLRRLRGELIGTSRAMRQLRGAGGLDGLGTRAGGRRHARRPGGLGALGIADRTRRRAFGHPEQRSAGGRGGAAGNVEAREARRAARRYARAWRAALVRSRDFRVAGHVAGRVTASTMAATAAASGRVFFARFRKQWHATGVRTGIVVGNAAGMTAGLVTAGMMTSSLANAMQRFSGMLNAIATSFGIQFGTQAGVAAGNAFIVNFMAAVQSIGAFGGGKGKGDDGGGGIFGKVGGAIGDAVGFVGDQVAPPMNVFKGLMGGTQEAVDALGGSKLVGKAFKWVPRIDIVGDAWDIGGAVLGGRWKDAGTGLLDAAIGDAMWVNDRFGELMNLMTGRDDPSDGGFLGDMMSEVMRGLNRMKYPGRARGGRVRTGETTLVGERGPEIVRLPGGSDVIPAHRSRQLLEQRDARVIRPRRDLHIHQHLDGREIARATLRNIDSEEQWR